MGSSQPSDSNMVFGYAIDESQDFFLDPPPEPAPGAPILSDNDSKIISSFFDDMTADHYNVPSFGEGLNYSDAWLSLPPQFMGTAPSLGQASFGAPLHSPGHELHHQDFSDLMPLGSAMMPPPPPPPQQHMMSHPRPSVEQQPSPDVLAAATLLQNGSSSRHHYHNTGGSMFSPPHRGIPSPLSQQLGHQLRHQPLEEFKRAERTNGFAESSMEEQHLGMFTDLVFGPSPAAPSRPAPPPPRQNHVPMEMQWGSDARFSSRPHSFIPDSAGETYDALSKNQLRHMECLEPSRSASNTRPSSPLVNGESSGAYMKKVPESASTRLEDVAEGPPRKRRKSRSAKEEDDDGSDDAEPPLKGARRKKGKEVATASGQVPLPTAENGMSGRRRKSATGPKPQRENLSEAQKRENHIRSEQKRRTLIKEGFDDLCELVPGLKGGGFSKSTMLTMAADWLEDMLQGNAKLTAQLDKLEGRA
ncbi:hypothetical protein HYQ45_015581 [Verticillium longisporum]|uniref:BHLH domain-containing protein n=1 Tax=Verticillium longisporum TaxID=100787 RepID=A0A8I2Z887_VERLO|nr:hypothetical protein HYQ45_015581 [Verticillium longisporum]